jgi:hypothetical protein
MLSRFQRLMAATGGGEQFDLFFGELLAHLLMTCLESKGKAR